MVRQSSRPNPCWLDSTNQLMEFGIPSTSYRWWDNIPIQLSSHAYEYHFTCKQYQVRASVIKYPLAQPITSKANLTSQSINQFKIACQVCTISSRSYVDQVSSPNMQLEHSLLAQGLLMSNSSSASWPLSKSANRYRISRSHQTSNIGFPKLITFSCENKGITMQM